MAYIEWKGVDKAFGGKPVLRKMSLAVNRGEVMFIIGTSGVGKSVTIKHLVGLLRIDAGEIWFDDRRIDQLSERELAPVRRRIGMVFQSSTLFDSMTLAENVALPLRKHKQLGHKASLAEARERLAQVYMQDYAERYPAELSDGMRKRAAIARTLALSPEVVLFDEPTTGLDPVSARRIDRLIRELADNLGVTAIVVSHDPPSIFGVADRIAFLYRGVVHVVATPAQLRASEDPIVQQFINGRSTGPMETPGF
ncbi:MAG: ATP-binding cassette domain-containing protein [Deltaproteobacteria bacterium]|nr:ATP-binding cassette domain-containing protein [Deltaproteobacteria bacterium]MCW5803455.1 ATP-binding cassette domain-containing protein [Deltaproteobacteria bacterium]